MSLIMAIFFVTVRKFNYLIIRLLEVLISTKTFKKRVQRYNIHFKYNQFNNYLT